MEWSIPGFLTWVVPHTRATPEPSSAMWSWGPSCWRRAGLKTPRNAPPFPSTPRVGCAAPGSRLPLPVENIELPLPGSGLVLRPVQGHPWTHGQVGVWACLAPWLPGSGGCSGSHLPLPQPVYSVASLSQAVVAGSTTAPLQIS